ncbi:uncharacterized protein LOC127257050 [Andrographis paniculata]|uniref:uncharacterized protein LOC127257050 n=1 Tax=Andrographis paniculata TaxID=175694 RepID=UPI0021E71599|nr:uncharacterized protein LOC127257050 [Andrographis paniculata]XP_051139281.1 uncharacterized protein LOC127257050 [Andrographis paniculata]
MELQSATVFALNQSPPPRLRNLQFLQVKHRPNPCALFQQIPRLQVHLESLSQSLRSGILLRPASLNSSRRLNFRVDARNRSDEPYRGKSGSVSFGGLSHESIEEDKLVSSPFKENTGSLLWILAPLALVSAVVGPPFFVAPAIYETFRNETFAEILSSFSTEAIFYVGLTIFLHVTDRVQKPYLQFSQKRWSLITGLQGYLASTFFTTGIKFIFPLFALYVTWPAVGLSSLVAVGPFMLGILAQFAFERIVEHNGSACWPLVPIMFEIYRIYQLTRATSYMETLLFGMRNATVTNAVLNRRQALLSLIVVFRVLGVVCLWSLLTFLLRLFPSRPVSENY